MLRGAAHWLIMWGCIIAAAITFPLVWGWIEFRTAPDDRNCTARYFGFPAADFRLNRWQDCHFPRAGVGLVLVIAGVIIAFRSRMVDHGAIAVQQIGDILPLVLLFAIASRACC